MKRISTIASSRSVDHRFDASFHHLLSERSRHRLAATPVQVHVGLPYRPLARQTHHDASRFRLVQQVFDQAINFRDLTKMKCFAPYDLSDRITGGLFLMHAGLTRRRLIITLFCAACVASSSRSSPPAKRPRSVSSPQVSTDTAKHDTASDKPKVAPNPPKHDATPDKPKVVPKMPKRHQSPYAFSDLALFLFGSGFALFVALLGWSDQIRGLANETRDLQSEFVRKYHLSLADLLRAVRAETPDERFAALTSLMHSRKLDTAAAVSALPLFRTWESQSTFLERLYAFKYGLTITLSAMFFIAGFCSVATVLSDLVLLIVPGILLVAIFVLIVWTNVLERKFHGVLTKMLEAM